MEFNISLEDCGTKEPRNGYCPEITDGLLCWPETPAGIVANQSCPKTFGYNQYEFAYKICWDNGTWYKNVHNYTWTNYSRCVNRENMEFINMINNIFVLGYSISLAALIISLWIFFTFRTLKCIRIRIHIQLFLSFALNNIMWIIWYEVIIPDLGISIRNDIWCQIHHILKEYFMMANYMWMFCEALHLHIALVVVFVREEVTMKWFYWIGWCAPIKIVMVHCLVRFYVTKDTDMCWMHESFFSSWFLSIPICVTLVASLIFLINVLRVLLTIMHPNSQNPAPMGIRRAARAAFILTPLFGLQHILLPTQPDEEHPLFKFYHYTTVVIIPFQGLCVSCLFCFANQDVHQAVSAFFHRRMHRSIRWSNYHYTGAVDSAGVYVVNGNSQTNNIALLTLNHKPTTQVTI